MGEVRQTDARDFIICPMPCYSSSVIVHIVSRSTFEHWSELTSSLVCDTDQLAATSDCMEVDRQTNCSLSLHYSLYALCILPGIRNAKLLLDIRPSILFLSRFFPFLHFPPPAVLCRIFQSCIFMSRIFSVPILSPITHSIVLLDLHLANLFLACTVLLLLLLLSPMCLQLHFYARQHNML